MRMVASLLEPRQLSIFDEDPAPCPSDPRKALREAVADAERELGRPVTLYELLDLRTRLVVTWWLGEREATRAIEDEALAIARERPVEWYLDSLKQGQPIARHHFRRLPKARRAELDRLAAAIAQETDERRIADMLAAFELPDPLGSQARLYPSAYCLAFLAKAREPQVVRKILDYCGVSFWPRGGVRKQPVGAGDKGVA